MTDDNLIDIQRQLHKALLTEIREHRRETHEHRRETREQTELLIAVHRSLSDQIDAIIARLTPKERAK